MTTGPQASSPPRRIHGPPSHRGIILNHPVTTDYWPHPCAPHGPSHSDPPHSPNIHGREARHHAPSLHLVKYHRYSGADRRWAHVLAQTSAGIPRTIQSSDPTKHSAPHGVSAHPICGASRSHPLRHLSACGVSSSGIFRGSLVPPDRPPRGGSLHTGHGGFLSTRSLGTVKGVHGGKCLACSSTGYPRG